MSWRTPTTRRVVIGIVAAAAAAAVALRQFRFVQRYRRRSSRYDDLLSKLSDRDVSERFGGDLRGSGALSNSAAIAELLRSRLAHVGFATLVASELSTGRMLEANRWIVPESLALICALAANER